jgi:hypothetical protein
MEWRVSRSEREKITSKYRTGLDIYIYIYIYIYFCVKPCVCGLGSREYGRRDPSH